MTIANEVDGRLPEAVEAALYYVASESLTNVVKYANASEVNVSVRNAVAGRFWRKQGYSEFLERLRREL